VRCGPTNDCYTLTINDSEGDGICCGYGQGNFEVNVDGQRAGGDGEFCFKYNVSFSRYSVEVKLSPRTDGGPEDTRATLTDHRMEERLEYYRFRKTNTNYSVFDSVALNGSCVFEATASIADGLRLESGSGGFDLICDERGLIGDLFWL
jgi:hypothetical protein